MHTEDRVDAGDPTHAHGRRMIALAISVLLVALAGVVGAWLGWTLRLDLPDVRGLEDYRPLLMSHVLAADGTTIDTFAEQRRMLIGFSDIPESFRNALIATEDAAFYEHTGVDPAAIARALASDIRHMRLAQGASTITQQLARDLFLHRKKTLRRKLEEALLALEIERTYSKDEILTFYANQVYMGHGRYGLEAASRFYFGKPARELGLPESAALAGLVQRPEALSPIRDPERALARRRHVLARMVVERMIDAETARAAQAAPLKLADEASTSVAAPYFVEEVRRWLKSRFGDAGVYREGLEVQTTLDPALQRHANAAIDAGLRALDKRQGWRGAPGRVPADSTPETWESPAWRRAPREGEITDAVVTAVGGGSARLRVGPVAGTLRPRDAAWTRKQRVSDLVRVGDIVRVRLVHLEPGADAAVTLEQDPEVEAALVAIEPRTGEIRALTGGFDFRRSEFDRATQARRQTGSAFKPFVFAAALQNGWTLADRIVDEPTVFLDPGAGAAYQPENYTHKYYGALTLREAAERSANIATVKLLLEVGYEPVIRLARDLGIRAELKPYPSLALGAFEVTLLELTSAYGAFANLGVWVEPHLIREVRDSGGSAVHRVDPEIRDSLRPEVAGLVNRLLEGVVTDGTGKAAASLGRPLAGKTGTTDDNTDAWFVGYAPDLVVGVWVGFDAKRSLGARETGSEAALPIWKEFMERAFDGRPPEAFPEPRGLLTVPIDRRTGLRYRPADGCPAPFAESFLEGSEPSRPCSSDVHRLLDMPYTLHPYEVGTDGVLRIPADDLPVILARDSTLRVSADGSEIRGPTRDGEMGIRFVTVPGGSPAPPEDLVRRLEAGDRKGTDGRGARVVRSR